MRIVVLNGSPRTNGNTAKMVAAFKEGAEYSYYEDFVDYSGLEGKGILHVAGDVREANIKEARDFGANL